MSDYRRLVVNTLATFSGRAASAVLALVLSTLLFRWLGASLYGIWSFFFVLVSYSSSVDLGISTTIERFVARSRFEGDRQAIEDSLNICITFAVILSLLLEIVLALLPDSVWRHVSSNQLRLVCNVFPLCLLLTNVGSVTGAGLAGVQRMGRLHLIRSTANLFRTLVVVSLAAAGIRRLDLLLLAYSTAGLSASFACWWELEKVVGRLRFRPLFFHREMAGEYLRFGSAVQTATLSYQVGDQLFRLLIGGRYGVAAMGYYDLGARLAFVLRSFASALLATMVPFGTEKHLGEGPSGISKLHRFSVKYLALFVLPTTAVVFYYSREIIELWLGGALGSETVLAIFRILLVGNAVALLGGPAAMIGRSTGRPRTEAAGTLAGVALGLAFAAAAPGLDSAVLLYAIGSFGAALLIWFLLWKVLGFEAGATWDLLRVAGWSLVVVALTAILDRVAGAVVVRGSPWFSMLRWTICGGLSLAAVLLAVWNTSLLSLEEKQFWRRRFALR
jgi:O-antigen/teichoic acid export membrane protein